MIKYSCDNCGLASCNRDVKQVPKHEEKFDDTLCPFRQSNTAAWKIEVGDMCLTPENLEKLGIKWPEWADGAVVHSDGSASFYRGRIIKIYQDDWVVNEEGEFKPIQGVWDRSDWRNSRILNPNKILNTSFKTACKEVIPAVDSWMKKGSLVYHPDGGYGFISQDMHDYDVFPSVGFLNGSSWNPSRDNLWEARCRAWDKTELLGIVGRTLKNHVGNGFCVDRFYDMAGELTQMVSGIGALTADWLAKEIYDPNGWRLVSYDKEAKIVTYHACGVLERRRNDKSEWIS